MVLVMVLMTVTVVISDASTTATMISTSWLENRF